MKNGGALEGFKAMLLKRYTAASMPVNSSSAAVTRILTPSNSNT
jgi:hypothetical protein